MRRPRKLWIALGLFCILLLAFVGLFLWAQYGYSHTIIIYEAVSETGARATPDGAATEEVTIAETEGVTAEEAPPWSWPARWGTLSAAVVIAGYLIYLEVNHRRKQRVSHMHS